LDRVFQALEVQRDAHTVGRAGAPVAVERQFVGHGFLERLQSSCARPDSIIMSDAGGEYEAVTIHGAGRRPGQPWPGAQPSTPCDSTHRVNARLRPHVLTCTLRFLRSGDAQSAFARYALQAALLGFLEKGSHNDMFLRTRQENKWPSSECPILSSPASAF